METCFCAAAAVVYFLTVLWTLRRHDTGRWPAVLGALGALLSLTVEPGVCGVALLTCSLGLAWVAARRAELLPVQGRAVLVTGCDSGFGHALATLLSERGVRVFAGVLDVNGPGAEQLRQRGSEELRVLQLDVTDCRQIEAAYQHIRSEVGDAGLWALVNNAGILPCLADAELQPITSHRRVMDVNFLSVVKMCQVFLPLLRRSRGRIVNVSSMGGEVPMPLYAAYGASKAALSLFSRIMRLELQAWGVKVLLIQPSGFRTNIFGNSEDVGRHRDQLLQDLSPEAREDYGEAYISSLPGLAPKIAGQLTEDLSPMVEAMFHALLAVRPRRLYTPGQMAWLLPFLQSICPSVAFDAFLRSLNPSECEPEGLRTL